MKKEEKAVRELLAKMQGKLILLLCLFMLGLPVLAEPLKATVSYTEENARIEAFEGVRPLSIKYAVSWDEPKYYFDLNAKNDVYAIKETTARFLRIIPFKMVTVIYKDEPMKAYTYEKVNGRYKLATTDTFDKMPNNTIRSLRYDRDGHLMSVSLSIDLEGTEVFIFDADKKPIAHWVGNKGKEFTTNTNMFGKIIYSAP